MTTRAIEWSIEEIDIMLKLLNEKLEELQQEADTDSRHYDDETLDEFEKDFNLHRDINDKLLRASMK